MQRAVSAFVLFAVSFTGTFVFQADLEAEDGANYSVHLTDRKGRDVDYAVVTLTPQFDGPVSGGTIQTASAMVQRDRLFDPFVIAIQTGSSLSFPNEDDVRHQVYSFSKVKKFELQLYGKDKENVEGFPTAGIVPLGCNIHDNMLAYVHVHDAPIRAISGEDGTVVFQGLRAGPYQMEVWHPDAKRASNPVVQMVTISGGGSVDVPLDIRRRRYQEDFEEEDY